jgi:N-acetylglutamate synthase/N-acetylornithine aminotransferase
MIFSETSSCAQTFVWLQLIKDRTDDDHSNFDAMDVDPKSETSDSTNSVANGAEDSTNKRDSPQSYVSTVMLIPA